MATSNTPTSPSTGVWDAVKGALSIFKNLNKTGSVSEDLNPEPLDEFESDLSEVEIVQLVDSWKRSYAPYYSDIESGQTLSFEYWLGKQASDDAEIGRALVDNRIFQAIETFIPIATRANPDPLVQADPGPIGQQLEKAIKDTLVFEADRQKLRKVLKKLLRQWLIYRLGCIKLSFNNVTNQIETEAINPKRLVLDKDGHVDEAGFFTGQYIGEKKRNTAQNLIELFPKKKELITARCHGKLGSIMEYFEWWYKGTDVFYTMDDAVLGKFKNPHWNYDSQDGIEGHNYFDTPRPPYIFLSIFSTGLQPHDETSLILQNISLQDLINRRLRQIDRNVEGMNNGMVVSDAFTDSQASQAASALRKGMAIRAPGGDVSKAVMRFPPGNLPPIVFDTMKEAQNEIGNIFGTSGSTPEGMNEQDTVRGKIMVSQMDSSRIGGGITEYLEQVADSVYCYWTQLIMVHWTDLHYIIAAGDVSGSALVQMKNTDFALVKSLNITVKEGSLIPKDPLTKRNESIDLWSAGAIDPITFYKALDFTDPMHQAEQLIIWQMVQKGALPPQAYIATFGQGNKALQPQGGQTPGQPGMQPPPGVGGPAVNNLDASNNPSMPAPMTPGAVGAESKELIQSVPLGQA
jgi:hypothetical protein